MTTRATWLLALGLAVACQPLVEVDGSQPGSAGDAGTTTGWDPVPNPGGTSTGATTTGGVADGTGDPSVTFITRPDWSRPEDCDLFHQDCPRGQKCTIWASDGGGSWNATRCVDIARDPGGPGDPCTVVGSGLTGVDDCDLGLVCWGVDDNLEGSCIEFCRGSSDAPTCPEATTCTITGSGFPNVCIPQCDPLADDCDPGFVCVPRRNLFVCTFDISGDSGAHGDPCRDINACDPGTICLSADLHTDCPGPIGCCSTFCALSSDTSDAECAALDPNQTCAAYYAEGTAPPGYEDLGVCAVVP